MSAIGRRLTRSRADGVDRPAKPFDRPRFLHVLMGLFLLWTFAPIAIVVLFSFNSGKSLQNFEGFSTQWYSDFFGDQQLRDSLVAHPHRRAESALVREESRGSHFRGDFPATSEAFEHHVVLRPGAQPALETWQ